MVGRSTPGVGLLSFRRRSKPARGLSLSVMLCALIPALVLVIGLAVDGGAQVAANRDAQAVAAVAARHGADAAAGVRLLAGDQHPAAVAGVAGALATHPEYTSDVQVGQDAVQVRLTGSVPTKFLSLAGIKTLPVHGSASAAIRPR